MQVDRHGKDISKRHVWQKTMIKYIENSKQKIKPSILKRGKRKDMSRSFAEENIQMANEH